MPEEKNTLAASESSASIADNIATLPKTISEHSNPLIETMDDIITKKITDHLVSKATHHFESLLSQTKYIEDSTSNLALLMQRVNLQKSLITRACDWYGQKTVFEKIFIGVMFVATAALIGAAVNLSVVFGVLAIGIYCSLASILQDHYNVNVEPDKQFCSDVEAMEKTLAESIDHLKEMENNLHITLVELAEKNIQSAEQILKFENNIMTLDTKIISFEKIVADLEQVKLHLADENARIKEQLNTAHINLGETCDALAQRSTELNGIKESLHETTEQIAARTCQLNTLSEKLQADSDTLSILINEYEAQLQLLRTRVSISASDPELLMSSEVLELCRQADESIAIDRARNAQIILSRQVNESVPIHHVHKNMSMS